MKKLICLLLALTVVLAFAACDEKEEKKNPITSEQTEPTAVIFTLTVIHGDGEESTSRMTTEKETIAEALMDRTIMTEDMLTIAGEKADPAEGAYWTLYIDGVYATDPWNEIKVVGGSEYMFEYTVEMDLEGPVEDEEGADEFEGIPEEDIVDDIPEDIPSDEIIE